MSSKQNEPKQQHWVPQFYLSYFATLDTRNTRRPLAWVWDNQSGKAWAAPTSVKKVCGQRYLYTPVDKRGKRDGSLERWLDRLETDAGEIWPELTRDFRKLSNADLRRRMALFIAVMHLRNVFLFRTIESAITLRTKLYGELSEEFLARRGPDEPDPTHAGRFFAHTILTKAPRIAKIISNMRWRVLCADEDVFVTTDRPVIFQHRVSGRRGGPGIAGSLALFPVSPRRILVLDDSAEAAADYYPLPYELGSVFNRSMRQQCLRFMISGRSLSDVNAEIEVAEAAEQTRARIATS